MRKLVIACAGLLLASCASDGWVYDAPAGVSAQTLETDRENCALEAGVAMQPEDRGNMERACMLQRGYDLKREGG
ncbi:MAG TPA: hypothetical protein VM074_13390 [Solimonas sp.]|nr:hypothetical protein [Solimonas sp.]